MTNKDLTIASTTLDYKTIRDEGWSIKLLKQDDRNVAVVIYCSSEDYEWYSMTAKIQKNKLKRLK